MCSGTRRGFASSSCSVTASARSVLCRPSWGSTRGAPRSTLRLCGDRRRRVAARGDERLLPRRRRAGLRAARGGAGDHYAPARRAAVDSERARDHVTGAILVLGLGTVALGGALRGPADVRGRARSTPGGRSGARRPRRLLGARRGRRPRRVVHELVRASPRRRRPDRVLPRHARPDRRPGARVLDPVPGAGGEGAGRRRAHRVLRAGARARRLRARPAHLPARLGADHDLVRGGDPDCACGQPRRPPHGLHLRVDHAPGRGRDLDLDPAALRRRARSGARRRSRAARACSSRSRSPRSSGWARRPG